MALRHDLVFIPDVTVAYRLNNASICINNLREVARNSLFVQYLLLSHLWDRPAMSYAEVRPILDCILDERKLKYRERMWKAAICMSNRQYRQAAKQMAIAAKTSPARFLNRCSEPIRQNTMIRVGESPAEFQKVSDLLWPSRMPATYATAHI